MHYRLVITTALLLAASSLCFAGAVVSSVDVHVGQYFGTTIGVVPVSGHACVAGDYSEEWYFLDSPPLLCYESGIQGASGLPLSLVIGAVKCGGTAAPSAELRSQPIVSNRNGLFISPGHDHSEVCCGPAGCTTVDSFAHGHVVTRAMYSVRAPGTALSTSVVINFGGSATDSCVGEAEGRGLAALLNLSVPQPIYLWVAGSGENWTSSPELTVVTLSPGSFQATYTAVVSVAGDVSLANSIHVASGSAYDIDIDGSFDCADIALIQSHVQTGKPEFLPEQFQRLNVVCGEPAKETIDCEDLLVLAIIATRVFESCALGDVNMDGMSDWCDVSILFPLVEDEATVTGCDMPYDIFLDMNLDGVLDASDLTELRRPLQRRQGDATNDGNVNFADVTAVLANFGMTGPTWSATDGNVGTPGDANGDGMVLFNDVTAVLTNTSNACP